MELNNSLLNEDLLKKAKEDLDARYAACDLLGSHVNPTGSEVYCDNCFRHLSYQSPIVEEILESRKNIPLLNEPLDASLIHELRNREIQSQKEKDFFDGLSIILKEFREENLG